MIPFRQTTLPAAVPADVMERVYAKLLTPVKYGADHRRPSDPPDGGPVRHAVLPAE